MTAHQGRATGMVNAIIRRPGRPSIASICRGTALLTPTTVDPRPRMGHHARRTCQRTFARSPDLRLARSQNARQAAGRAMYVHHTCPVPWLQRLLLRYPRRAT
jgi:hypothetical protein